MKRIYLSSPHMSGLEQPYVQDAFATNWIAPLGPHVDAFEQEFAAAVGARHAAALSSGTAALHLALLLAGVGPGDEVIVSTLTFSASVNPIAYLGGRPVLIDSERRSWNLDPALVAETVEHKVRQGKPPKAVVPVHLYGQSADLAPIVEVCARYAIPVIEDAAEALGSSYHGRAPGVFGTAGVFSFNGNKIITTSGGGMLVSDDPALMVRARKLSTQAREPAPHYEHVEIGFNYRMSNVLAGIGRGQLKVLAQRVEQRRRVFDIYRQALADLPELQWMPEPEGYHSTRWLTCFTLAGTDGPARRDRLLRALERHAIEARPVWKPMHLQPLFEGAPYFAHAPGDDVAARLFERGVCLPSGSNLTDAEIARVIDHLRRLLTQSVASHAAS